MTFISDFRAAVDPVVVFERAFGLVPHAWQLEYLRETRPTVVLKGRQVGASLGAAALAIHTAVYQADVNVVIVSPSQKQSQEITGRARTGLRNLGVALVQDSSSVLRLAATGSRIISLPGTARSVRGWNARLLVLDECAFLEHDTVVAARALVAATGGRLLAQSTPGAEHGDFHEMVKAQDPEWARFTVRSDSVGTISREWLAAERRAMSPDVYSREFECQFGRGAGGSLFTLEGISRWMLPPKEEPHAD